MFFNAWSVCILHTVFAKGIKSNPTLAAASARLLLISKNTVRLMSHFADIGPFDATKSPDIYQPIAAAGLLSPMELWERGAALKGSVKLWEDEALEMAEGSR